MSNSIHLSRPWEPIPMPSDDPNADKPCNYCKKFGHCCKVTVAIWEKSGLSGIPLLDSTKEGYIINCPALRLKSCVKCKGYGHTINHCPLHKKTYQIKSKTSKPKIEKKENKQSENQFEILGTMMTNEDRLKASRELYNLICKPKTSITTYADILKKQPETPKSVKCVEKTDEETDKKSESSCWGDDSDDDDIYDFDPDTMFST